jgi:hypothetical protein
MPDGPRAGTGQATEGWAVNRRLLVACVLASAVPALAQVPSARLAPPVPQPTIAQPPITVRASDPDNEGGPPPAARLGAVSNARIGQGPDDASDEEKYNWGAGRKKATTSSRDKSSDTSRSDRDEDYGGKGAKLRTPAPGRTASNGRGGPDDPDVPPPPSSPPDAPPDPGWWPGRNRDLQDLRDQLPVLGDRDRDRLAFQSDCAFDNFSSPITNPFLAEDPRSLTELRPLYFYQGIPSSQYFYQGGHLSFIGVQARAAITDRFSVTINKLGWSSITSGNPLASSDTGFSEIWIAPKFVFWRDPETQTLASFGLQFQMPVGNGTVYQDTGGLGLLPYLSFGRMIGKTDYGSFHLINVAGYHLGTGAGRSDYFFDSLHLDLDVADNHRFYPTLELNWFHNSTNGTGRSYLFFEGRDFANVGASAAGRDLLTIAPGFRYRFTDYLQLGLAVELPLVGSRDLFQYRFGIDLIWRY